MYRCLILLPILASTAISAAPAWTWVDASGRRHFSDRPVEGATLIELPGSDVPAAPPAPASAAAPTPATDSAAPQTEVALVTGQTAATTRYQRFEIVSPADAETVWNTGGVLSVQLTTDPPLQTGHSIDIIVDGSRRELRSTSLELNVPDVYRGQHTIQALILSATGRELARSDTVTIMMQQTSVLNPNNGAPPAAARRNTAN